MYQPIHIEGMRSRTPEEAMEKEGTRYGMGDNPSAGYRFTVRLLLRDTSRNKAVEEEHWGETKEE
jgi:hypothetical protein